MTEVVKKKKTPKKIVTYKYKLFTDHKQREMLSKASSAVNMVWNYCNNISDLVYKSVNRDPYNYYNDIVRKKSTTNNGSKEVIETEITYYINKKGVNTTKKLKVKNGSLTSFDLINLCSGAVPLIQAEDVLISKATVEKVCEEYFKARINKAKSLAKPKKTKKRLKKSKIKRFIRFRGRKNRKFIPFKGGVKLDAQYGYITYLKQSFKLAYKNDKNKIEGSKILSGQFVEDPDGWYICLSIESPVYKTKHKPVSVPQGVLGLDLGSKDMITCSNGDKFSGFKNPIVSLWGKKKDIQEHIFYLKSLEDQLKNKRPIDPVTKKKTPPNKKEKYLRIKRLKLEQQLKRAKDQYIYSTSHQILDKAETVVIGDLSGKLIQKLCGKKSQLLQLGSFKTKIQWIAKKRNQNVILIPEHDTTKTCSVCQKETGPTGLKDLGVRSWVCSNCGAAHDRDINAAKNMVFFYERSKVSETTGP